MVDAGIFIKTAAGLKPLVNLPGPRGVAGPPGDGVPTGGLPVIAKNGLLDPTFKGGGSSWGTINGPSVSYDTTAGTATVGVTGASQNSQGLRSAAGPSAPMVVAPGQTIKAIADVTINSGTNPVRVMIEYFNSSGSGFGSSSHAGTLTSGLQELIGVVPAGANRANIRFSPTTGSGDVNFTVKNCLLTDDPEQQAYFDGTAPGARWVGAAHASMSELVFVRSTDLDVFKTKRSLQRGFNRYSSEPETWAQPFNPGGATASVTGALQVGFNVDPTQSIMLDVDLDLYSYSPHLRTTVHASVYSQANGAMGGPQARVQSNRLLITTQKWAYPSVTWIRSPSRTRLYLIIGGVTDVLGYPEAVVRRVSARYGAQGILSDPDYSFITSLPGGDAATCSVIDDWGVYRGAGDPNGVVQAPAGSEYIDGAATNGITKWIKNMGASNTSTGWSPAPTVGVSSGAWGDRQAGYVWPGNAIAHNPLGAFLIAFPLSAATGHMIHAEVEMTTYLNGVTQKATVLASCYNQGNGAISGPTAMVDTEGAGLVVTGNPMSTPRVTWMRSADKLTMYLRIGTFTDQWAYTQCHVKRITDHNGNLASVGAPTISTVTSDPAGVTYGYCTVQDRSGTFLFTGSPEGVITAIPGAQYKDWSGTNGIWEWRKATGTGSTGWVAIAPINQQRANAQAVRVGWYVGHSGAASLTMTLNTVYFKPIRIGKGGTLTSARVRLLTGGGAGSLIRLGLYAHDPTTGFPVTSTAPLADFGTKDTSANGVITWSPFTQVVADDSIYWYAIAAQGAGAPVIYATDETDPLIPRSSSVDSPMSGMILTGVTGAFGSIAGFSGNQSRTPCVVFGS